LKTNEQIVMKIDTKCPRVNDMKRSTSGARRSKEAEFTVDAEAWRRHVTLKTGYGSFKVIGNGTSPDGQLLIAKSRHACLCHFTCQ